MKTNASSMSKLQQTALVSTSKFGVEMNVTSLRSSRVRVENLDEIPLKRKQLLVSQNQQIERPSKGTLADLHEDSLYEESSTQQLNMNYHSQKYMLNSEFKQNILAKTSLKALPKLNLGNNLRG